MKMPTEAQAALGAEPERCDHTYGRMVQPDAKRLVLQDLAYECIHKYGDAFWTFYCCGRYKMTAAELETSFKVRIENSATLLRKGLVSVSTAEEEKQGDSDDAESTLIVVPEGGKLIAYECDRALLMHIGETRGSWIKVECNDLGEVLAIPLDLVKVCATRAFEFESEFHDRLIASGAEKAHA